MKSILFLSALFISFTVFPQSFPLKSSKWYYTNNGASGSTAMNTYLWILDYDGDTLIQGDTARIVKRRGNPYMGLLNKYIFKSTKDTVWSITPSGEWGILYVFNAKVGDTIPVADFESTLFELRPYVLDSIVPYQHDTLMLNRFYVHPIKPSIVGEGFYDGYYTERIGSTFFYPTIYGALILIHEIIRCYEDDQIITHINFPSSDCSSGNPVGISSYDDSSIRVYPTLTTGKVKVESKINEIMDYKLYDLNGRMLIQKSAKGSFEFTMPDYLKDGIYLLSIGNNKGREQFKIQLQR